MARNSVQFQKGLSEAGFEELYGTEAKCRAALFAWRWPEGFVCPVCGGREGTRLSTRPKIQCASCRHQTSSTAGTIFAGTKLPLTRWFLAIRLIATAAEGITSVELGRRLGIKQTNAWALKRKLLRAMEHDDWRSPGDRRSRKRKLLPAKAAVPRKTTVRPPISPRAKLPTV